MKEGKEPKIENFKKFKEFYLRWLSLPLSRSNIDKLLALKDDIEAQQEQNTLSSSTSVNSWAFLKELIYLEIDYFNYKADIEHGLKLDHIIQSLTVNYPELFSKEHQLLLTVLTAEEKYQFISDVLNTAYKYEIMTKEQIEQLIKTELSDVKLTKTEFETPFSSLKIINNQNADSPTVSKKKSKRKRKGEVASDASNDSSPKNSLNTGRTGKTLKTDLEELVKKQSYQQATDPQEYNKNILSLVQSIKKLSKTYGLSKAQEKKLLKYLSQPGKQLDIDHLIKKLIFSKKFKKPYQFTPLPFKYDQPTDRSYSQDHIFDVTDPIEDNIIGLPPALDDASDDIIIIGDPEREDSQPKEIIIGDTEDQQTLNPFIVKEPGFIYKPYEQKSLNEIIKCASEQKGIQYQILPIQGFKAQNILQSAKAEGRVIQFLIPKQQAFASTGTDGPVNSEFARAAHSQAGRSATRGAILQGPGSRGFQPPRNPAFTFTVPSVSSLASGYITIFMVLPRAHTDISVITSDSTTSTDKSMAFLDLGYMAGTMWAFTKYVAAKYPKTAAVIMVGTAGKHMWDTTQPLLRELEKGQRGMTVYHVNEKDYLKSGVSCTDGRRHVFLKHLDTEKKAPIFFRQSGQ